MYHFCAEEEKKLIDTFRGFIIRLHFQLMLIDKRHNRLPVVHHHAEVTHPTTTTTAALLDCETLFFVHKLEKVESDEYDEIAEKA